MSDSGAFRDTLIVAVVGVAGVAAMVVWSGGDPPTSAVDVEGTDLTLPPDFTLPPGFSLPEVSVSAGQAVAGDAVITALPAPSGATETPTGQTGHRFWSFTPGVSWDVVRDEYLALLRGQGYVADLAQSLNQAGLIGEVYTVTDAGGTATVSLTITDVGGVVTMDVTA